MDVVAAAVSLFEAKKALWDPLMNRIASSNDLKEIHDAMNDSIQTLQYLREEYENKVQRCRTKVPSGTYRQWICKVRKIEDEVKKLVDKYESGRSNMFTSRSSGFMKDMKKTGEQLGKLWEEGLQIKDKVLADPKLEPVVENNEAPKIKKFKTLQKPLEDILDLLKNDKVHRIGIRGPLGIGKTTIMWNLNNHEEVAKMFDIVIWVNVSKEDSKKNLSKERLQEAIVQRLQLQMEGNNNANEVAKTISMVLEDRKYLLLLDDVKEYLNLSQLGIPDCSNGSKLVLTTRWHHVCYLNDVDKEIKVECLSPKEAWKMFQYVLQKPKLINDRHIGPLALRVCKDCYGLPLLIEKVANTFKLKNSERIWSDGLNSWRTWPEKERQDIRELYNLLKFCYDDLDDDQKKKCFLYSALYPEDIDIYTEDLLECWAAEDFLGNDRDAHKVHLRNGDFILTHLKDVSLLEESQTEKHVIMHKIIRQVALYILEVDPDCKYLVKTSRALRKPPDVESWHEKNRISLGDNELDQLPNSPNCSMLSTLFLLKNLDLKIIPPSFFEFMVELKVLNLSHTGITLLPPSLSSLPSLKVLYLNNCKHLMELPSDIAKLEHLEALDIQGSGVNNIPPHIVALNCLRSLRVSFTKYGNGNVTQEVHFNYNTISKLPSLEELVIDVKSPEEWSNEIVGNIIKEVATLQEFKTLKFCFPNKVVDVIEVVPRTLRICVPEATILQSYIKKRSWENVQGIGSFKFFIGCENSEHPQIPDFVRYEKYVKYCNGTGGNFTISNVLAEADAFELVNHKDIKKLSDFGIASMNKVEGCLIESCVTIETIVDGMDNALLPNLKRLYIKNLPKLKSIWKGPMQPRSLTKLTTIVLTGCQLLVEIFPPGVIQELHEIQYLKIEQCEEIKEVITGSDVNGNLLELPKLKKLILLDLSNLRSICVEELLAWPSLKKLKIFNCPGLCELPFNQDNAKELICIKAEQNWWEALKWQNQEVKEQLQQLCKLR